MDTSTNTVSSEEVVVMVVVVAIVGLLCLMPLSRVLAREWHPAAR